MWSARQPAAETRARCCSGRPAAPPGQRWLPRRDKDTLEFPLLPTPIRCGPSSSSSASRQHPGMRWRGLRLMTSGIVVQLRQTMRGEVWPPNPRTAADAPAAPQVVAQAIPTCHSEPDPNAANPPSHLPLPPQCCDDRLKTPPQLCFTACTTAAVHFPARNSKIQGWHDRFSSASTRPSLDPANED